LVNITSGGSLDLYENLVVNITSGGSLDLYENLVVYWHTPYTHVVGVPLRTPLRTNMDPGEFTQ
jgi:hypothetical protein